MKRLKLRQRLLLLMGILFTSMLYFACSKGANSLDTPYNPALTDPIDVHSIDTFVQNRKGMEFASVELNVVKSDSTELRYQVISPGTGLNYPTVDSAVSFTYTLRLLTNSDNIISTVDLPGVTVSPLTATIPALTEGLQHLKVDGRMLLFVPSSLGFRDHPTDVTNNLVTGQQVITTVPPNSVLIFDVRLTSITKLETINN